MSVLDIQLQRCVKRSPPCCTSALTTCMQTCRTCPAALNTNSAVAGKALASRVHRRADKSAPAAATVAAATATAVATTVPAPVAGCGGGGGGASAVATTVAPAVAGDAASAAAVAACAAPAAVPACGRADGSCIVHLAHLVQLICLVHCSHVAAPGGAYSAATGRRLCSTRHGVGALGGRGSPMVGVAAAEHARDPAATRALFAVGVAGLHCAWSAHTASGSVE